MQNTIYLFMIRAREIPVITKTVHTLVLREMTACTSVPSKKETCEKKKKYFTYKAIKISKIN